MLLKVLCCTHMNKCVCRIWRCHQLLLMDKPHFFAPVCMHVRDLFIYQSKRECGRGKMYLMKKSAAWVWRKETDMPYFAFMTYISPHPRRSRTCTLADGESRQLISLWCGGGCNVCCASSTLLHFAPAAK
jgi:hypothetical protein